MKDEQIVKLLQKKIKMGNASQREKKMYFMLKKKIAGVEDKKIGDTEHVMDKHLSSLSGMKGNEKSIKDRIGRNMNSAERTYSTVEKIFDRINKIGTRNED